MASRGRGRRGRPRGNIATLLINFQQCCDVGAPRHDVDHQNLECHDIAVRPEKIPIFGKRAKWSFR